MKVYEQVSEVLSGHAVDTMFGLMGDANMYVSAHFEDAGGRFVRVTHEAGAVAMADGYARLSGRPGVASITHGPGFVNGLTALIEAGRSSSPVLVLTGDTPSDPTHPQRLDIEGVCAAVGIAHERVHSTSTVARDVNRAWRRLEHGSVVLNVPLAIATRAADGAGSAAVVHQAHATSDVVEDALDAALGIIASSARPVILAGRGATGPGAEQAIGRLAELLGAPIFTTALGRGLFFDHDHHVGLMGTLANEVAVGLVADSDCVVAFGASLNKYTTMSGELVQGRRLVQVDDDSAKLGWLVEPDERVLGDAGAVAAAMGRLLTSVGAQPRTHWAERARAASTSVRAWRPEDDRSGTSTVDIRLVSAALNDLLPTGAPVVSDVGRFVAGVWPYLNKNHAGDFVAMTGFGSIGLGLAAGIGGSIARPGSPTVVLAGDGGFMMGSAELSTAVREGLPMVILVFNDGAYGAEYQKLSAQGLNSTSSYNAWPDLCDVARGFGAQAIAVRALSDAAKVGEFIEGLEGPLLVDIHLDPTHHIDF